MCAQHSESKRGLIASVVTNRCPRCREGKLFSNPNAYNLKTTMDMPDHCPVCGQPFELQTGFYFGTGYVSYGLSVGIIGLFFGACFALGLISIYDNSVVYSLVVVSVLLVLLQPLLQRLSRSIWIAFFVRYDADARKHIIER